MDKNEAIEVLVKMRYTYDLGAIGSKEDEALGMAIEALEKDHTALDHIHNVVAKNEYKRGYEQGKADAISITWIESYLSDCAAGSIVYYVIKQMLYKWREEQNNGQTD